MGKGCIVTPRRRKELRMIPYLVRARNRVLAPLFELQAEGRGMQALIGCCS